MSLPLHGTMAQEDIKTFQIHVDTHQVQKPSSIGNALEISAWKSTIDEEISMIKKNGTWELVPLAKTSQPISLKWVSNGILRKATR